MAGRPRTMHRNVNELAARAKAFAEDLWALMPKQYHDRPTPGDPICEAWRASITSAAEGWRHLTELEELLGEKVRKVSPEDGPVTIDGETMSAAEWADLYDLPVQLVLERVRAGWDWELALVAPPGEPGSIADQPQPAQSF